MLKLKWLNEYIGIPEDVFTANSRVTVLSYRFISIENYKKIICVSEDNIRIKCKKYIVNIKGRKLMLQNFTDYEIRITGIICSISYEMI